MNSIISLYQALSIKIKMQIPCFKQLTILKFSNDFRGPVRIEATHQKNLRYPRRAKVPSDPRSNLILKKKKNNEKDPSPSRIDSKFKEVSMPSSIEYVEKDDDDGDGSSDCELKWSSDEIDAISSLFQGRIPQKPGNLYRERPLPLPIPHKLRPLGLPTPKRHVRIATRELVSSRSSVCRKVYKNPHFLVNLAREIKGLPPDKDVSQVLNKWVRFLRKGSLSLTIRELGHLGLPDRALQTFCWAKKHSHLFPDNRILAATVEILARSHKLKLPFDLEKFTSLASRTVIEAMVKGLIRGGSLNHAWKLLRMAKKTNRTLDSSVHAKMILELGRNPDKSDLALVLLDELGEREELKLSQQDCTAVMKVCVRLRQFEMVESLFKWFVESGRDPSIVMYTTLIHSRYSEKKFREAMAVVWEMENLNCLYDLPAYRMVIKLFVALNDVSRAVRYFARLKEAGFAPTYDIYRDLIKINAASGRLAKCKEICKEVESAGFKFDKQTESLVMHVERGVQTVS